MLWVYRENPVCRKNSRQTVRLPLIWIRSAGICGRRFLDRDKGPAVEGTENLPAQRGKVVCAFFIGAVKGNGSEERDGRVVPDERGPLPARTHSVAFHRLWPRLSRAAARNSAGNLLFLGRYGRLCLPCSHPCKPGHAGRPHPALTRWAGRFKRTGCPGAMASVLGTSPPDGSPMPAGRRSRGGRSANKGTPCLEYC